MTVPSQTQVFSVARVEIQTDHHVYSGHRKINSFTVTHLKLYDLQGNRIPMNIALYSALEKMEISFKPRQTFEHD